MTTAQKISKLEQEVRELRELFSALVPLDTEGEYKASFVRTLDKTVAEKPVGTYEGRGSLLKLVA